MNDRELLELAAKAIEYRIKREASEHCLIVWDKDDDCFCWNPLTDDGDALRLAVRLNMVINIPVAVRYDYTNNQRPEGIEHDPYAATRRSIVRAAAEIGRSI